MQNLQVKTPTVVGCNGVFIDGYTNVSCYLSGSVHWNGKVWQTANIYFQDIPGPYYKKIGTSSKLILN